MRLRDICDCPAGSVRTFWAMALPDRMTLAAKAPSGVGYFLAAPSSLGCAPPADKREKLILAPSPCVAQRFILAPPRASASRETVLRNRGHTA